MFVQSSIVIQITFFKHGCANYFYYGFRVYSKTITTVQCFFGKHDVGSSLLSTILIGVKAVIQCAGKPLRELAVQCVEVTVINQVIIIMLSERHSADSTYRLDVEPLCTTLTQFDKNLCSWAVPTCCNSLFEQ